MKKIVLTIVSISAIACNNQAPSKTEDKKPVSKYIFGYKGNIKTASSIITDYHFNHTNNTIDTTTRYTYDSFNTDGNIILCKEYNDIPSIQNNDTVTSTYTQEAYKTTQTLIYIKNKVVSRETYTWTNDTQFTVTSYENDSIKQTMAYTLNRNFSLIKMKYTNYKGTYKNESTTEIHYNENNEIVGRTFSLIELGSTTKTDIKTVDKDKQGNPLKTMWYNNETGKLTSQKIMSYTYYK